VRGVGANGRPGGALDTLAPVRQQRGRPARPARKGQVMREDARQRATEFVKELYAAGEIDAGLLDTGVAGVLAAKSEDELALPHRDIDR